MTPYLIDTSVFLWNFGETQRLGPRVRELLRRSVDPVFVSAATSWEIAIKTASGKLQLPESPRDFFRTRLALAGFRPLPITQEHALTAGELPRLHSDPFDRMLVAQAQTENMVLITSDRQLLKYSVPTLWSGK
jgi:PIN domain nuclease of toxin-antitoxin system